MRGNNRAEEKYRYTSSDTQKLCNPEERGGKKKSKDR